MGRVATMAARFHLQVVVRGDLELVDVRAARRIVDACAQEGFPVLGIEGFRLREGATVPEMTAIADFSGMLEMSERDRAVQSAQAAHAFLDTVTDPELLFELVFPGDE